MIKYFLFVFLVIISILILYFIYNYFVFKVSKNLSQNKFSFIEINNNKIKVEIASDFLKRVKGLSGREKIKEDEGMLFIFEKPDIQKFWMKGMKFGIDIVWIKGNKVVGFIENVLPEPGKLDFELKIYQSPEEVDKVLELKQGGVKRFKIKIGDEINFYLK